MTTFYAPRRSRPKQPPAVVASFYRVTSKLGARIMERKSMNSTELGKLDPGTQFHAIPSDAWVRRLDGGCVLLIALEEIK